MPIVIAGSKVNFITGYTADGNAQADYGKNVWLAQSFPLTALSRIYRCPFKFWQEALGHVRYFALRHALPDGTPTGANIVETHRPAHRDQLYSPGIWLLIAFDSFPELTPGNYALLAYVPDSHLTTDQHISAQSVPRLYTDGKAFKSTDSGNTWSEIPNTNLLFQIWGYQEPPAPPPPSEIGNWYQTNLTYFLTLTGYRIVTTTNRPVHQFLRWTITPPQKHVKPIIVRGAVAGTYIDQCFVVYYDIEQSELGDTFFHTFIVEPWPVCQTRYFYFWATKLAELMPSASPIYEKHRYAPPTPTTVNIYSGAGSGHTTCDGRVGRVGVLEPWATIHDTTGNSVLVSSIELDITLSAATVSARWRTLYRAIATFSLASIPVGSTILSATLNLYCRLKSSNWTPGPATAIYESYPNNPDTLVLQDYLHTYNVALSNPIAFSSLTVGAFNVFTLTPLGLSKLIPGQIVKLAIRDATWDAPNSPPVWHNSYTYNLGFYAVDRTIPAQRPYLEITYLPP